MVTTTADDLFAQLAQLFKTPLKHQARGGLNSPANTFIISANEILAVSIHVNIAPKKIVQIFAT